MATFRPFAFLADIGGTHVRCALDLGDGSAPTQVKLVRADDYPDLAAVIRAYLAEVGGPVPHYAALAVAGPAIGDKIALTNRNWVFSQAELKSDFGFEAMVCVNDFAAQAYALAVLGPGDVEPVGGGVAVSGAPCVVIGPGTGLGVAGLIWVEGKPVPIGGEGGHATLAPIDAREAEILNILRRRFTHVSAERVLCGEGLCNLYHAVAAMRGVPAGPLTPQAIAGEAGANDLATETLDLFFSFLGNAAGSLALIFAARGGVYLAGGILPKLGAQLNASRFRERFVSKGRFVTYLEAIPTRLVVAPTPALGGLQAALRAADLKKRATN